MTPWIISLLVAISGATWCYVQLARMNGNASPTSNYIAGGVVGVVIFLFIFSFLKLVLNF